MSEANQEKIPTPKYLKLKGALPKGIHIGKKAAVGFIGLLTLVFGMIIYGIAERESGSTKETHDSNSENVTPAIEQAKKIIAQANSNQEMNRQQNFKPQLFEVPPLIDNQSNSDRFNHSYEAINQQQITSYQQALNSELNIMQASNLITNQTMTQNSSDTSLNPNDKEVSNDLANSNKTNVQQNSHYFSKPTTPFVLQPSHFISAILLTGIHNEITGQVLAQVKLDAYDSIKGQYLLIPKGTKVVGTYEQKVMEDEERLSVTWTQFIFPNGEILHLTPQVGADSSGQAGLTDQINHHYGKRFLKAFLTSSLAYGGQSASSSPLAQPASQMSQEISQTINETTQKPLTTLTIRPGYEFIIQINQEIVFAKPYA